MLGAAAEQVLDIRALLRVQRSYSASSPGLVHPRPRARGDDHKVADGEEVAWDKVRLRLQEIVDSEDKTKPLSDDSLVEALSKHGITVARRTVTKYRKAMDIPSSRQRRDWSQAEK